MNQPESHPAPKTLAEIAGNDLARQRAINADLVLTLANRKTDVAEILGVKQRILGINYIPSERTRTLLAGSSASACPRCRAAAGGARHPLDLHTVAGVGCAPLLGNAYFLATIWARTIRPSCRFRP